MRKTLIALSVAGMAAIPSIASAQVNLGGSADTKAGAGVGVQTAPGGAGANVGASGKANSTNSLTTGGVRSGADGAAGAGANVGVGGARVGTGAGASGNVGGAVR